MIEFSSNRARRKKTPTKVDIVDADKPPQSGVKTGTGS